MLAQESLGISGIFFSITKNLDSLPFAFLKSGFLLGIICLSCAAMFSLQCTSYVLEVTARANGITDGAKKKNVSNAVPDNRITFRKYDFTSLFEMFTGLPGKFIFNSKFAVNSQENLFVNSLFFFIVTECCGHLHLYLVKKSPLSTFRSDTQILRFAIPVIRQT